MPREVLRAYADKMASVRAAETLGQIQTVRVADAFRLKPASARLTQRRLQRDARGTGAVRKADKASLAVIGIKTREVSRG